MSFWVFQAQALSDSCPVFTGTASATGVKKTNNVSGLFTTLPILGFIVTDQCESLRHQQLYIKLSDNLLHVPSQPYVPLVEVELQKIIHPIIHPLHSRI